MTNRPAYYRLPIFERLDHLWDVDFYFTAPTSDRFWLEQHPSGTGALRNVMNGVSPRNLYSGLSNGRYDCAIASLGGRSHLGATAAALSRHSIPFVLWVGMWYQPQTLSHTLARPFVRWLIHRADAIVAYGPHVTEWLSSEWGRTRNIVEFVNAIDNQAFAAPCDPRKVQMVRDRFDLDVETIVAFVGRLESEKGIPYLLDALTMTPRSVGLVIIGTGSEERSLVENVRNRGLEHRVRFCGLVDQQTLPTFLRASDMLVVPSITTKTFREPWGLVANEALNAGIPVVSTDAVGAAAGGLIVNGSTGLVVPERDSHGLAHAILTLAGDSELRSQLGRAGAKHVARWNHTDASRSFETAVAVAMARGERSDAVRA